MPSIECRCGRHLSYGEIPSPIEWRILSDVEFDRFVGTVEVEAIYAATRLMLRCTDCERLWVCWEDHAAPIEYQPVSKESSI